MGHILENPNDRATLVTVLVEAVPLALCTEEVWEAVVDV